MTAVVQTLLSRRVLVLMPVCHLGRRLPVQKLVMAGSLLPWLNRVLRDHRVPTLMDVRLILQVWARLISP